MIRKQIQLTERQAAAVRREAARRGVSEAAFIRDALERVLGHATDAERWRRALNAVGRFSSRDGAGAAREHDKHLADAYRE